MKKLFSLVLVAASVFISTSASASASVVCDTIFNQNAVVDTPTYYTVTQTSDSGYVSGNNAYGDLAKAEGFASVVGDVVTSADLVFAVVNINVADSDKTLKVMVWDNTGTANNGNVGAPGHAIDSATVTLREIAEEVTYINANQSLAPVSVNFTGNVVLTGDTFYVGVMLPTTTGDTVALFNNIPAQGADVNGWELNGPVFGGGWNPYNDDWGLPMGNYIVAGVCSLPNGVITLKDAATVKIYPNPATDVLNLEWSQQSNAEVNIISMTGTVVRSFETTGAMLNTYDVHDLAAGAYIVRVTDKATNENQSMLFSKF